MVHHAINLNLPKNKYRGYYGIALINLIMMRILYGQCKTRAAAEQADEPDLAVF
jgi:hypothetical protein